MQAALRSLRNLSFRPPLYPRSLVAGHRRSMSSASGHATSQSTGNGQSESPALFAHSQRLVTGRALVQDVWSIFNAANLPKDTINLGQGYMNFPPPKWVREAADQALNTVQGNHYAHPKGHPRLRKAIKDFYEPAFHRTLDVESEIQVTSGANEGMYAVWTAFLEEGDEVILFEPFFDQYISNIVFNGGVPVYVPMHPHKSKVNPNLVEWRIDMDELRNAITPRTKMIVVNTPHNPCGKVYSRHELEQIADLAKQHNLMVMSDEVYDLLVFDDHQHVRIANLPGMWERTITVMSAGKAFAATGWRVGYMVGPSSLIKYVLAATTRIVFTTNTPLQEAAAAGLEQAVERRFFETQTQEYKERRDVLIDAFVRLGLPYTVPEGAYFALLDISTVKIPQDYVFPEIFEGRGRDYKACWFIAHEIGVSSIPVSEFFAIEHCHIGEAYARFAFCKDIPTLKEAGDRLQGLKKYI